MSESRGKGNRKGGLFREDAGVETDRLIEETQRLLENTQRFLDHIHESDGTTRQYVKELKATLESDLRRQRRDKAEREPREEPS